MLVELYNSPFPLRQLIRQQLHLVLQTCNLPKCLKKCHSKRKQYQPILTANMENALVQLDRMWDNVSTTGSVSSSLTHQDKLHSATFILQMHISMDNKPFLFQTNRLLKQHDIYLSGNHMALVEVCCLRF